MKYYIDILLMLARYLLAKVAFIPIFVC